MAAFTVDEELVSHIKKNEGFRAKPYDDRGRPAIGYGQQDFDPDVTEIDEVTADRMLREDLSRRTSELNKEVTRTDLTAGQKNALIDMKFNVKDSALRKAKFWEKVNSGTPEEIRNSISQYHKSRNPNTGQLESLKGLRDRRDQRLAMWDSSSVQAKTNDGYDFDADIPDSESVDISQGYDFDSDMGDEISPVNNLTMASELSEEGAFQLEKDAANLADTLGMSKDLATLAVETGADKNLVMRRENNEIKQLYPQAYEWASNPKNYPLLKSDPEFMKSADQISQEIAESRGITEAGIDMSSAFSHSVVDQNTRAAIYLHTGMSNTQKKEQLRELDRKKRDRDNYYYQDQIDNIMKQGAKSLGKLKEAANLEADMDGFSIPNELAFGDSFIQKSVKDELNELKAGRLTEEAMFGRLDSMVKNPYGYAVISSESASSIANTLTGSMIANRLGYLGTLAVTKNKLLAESVSKVTGFLGGIATSYPVLYAQAMQEEMDKHKLPDGSTDYDAIFDNPETMNRLKNKADIYSVINSTFESTSLFVAGKFGFGGKASPSVGVMAKTKKVLAGFGKETVGQGGLEGAGELVSTVPAELYYEGIQSFTPEKRAEIRNKVTEEIAYSMGSGGTVGTMAAGYKKYKELKGAKLQDTREKVSKVVHIKRKVVKAAKNFDQLEKLRETVQKSAAANEFKGKAKEFVAKAMDGYRKEKPQVDGELDVNNIEEVSDEQVGIVLSNNEKAQVDQVSFNVKIFEALVNRLPEDITPEDVVASFGEDALIDYKMARETGVSFSVALGDYMFSGNDSMIKELNHIAHLNGADLNITEGAHLDNKIDEIFETISGDDISVDMSPETDEEVNAINEMIQLEDANLPPIPLGDTVTDEDGVTFTQVEQDEESKAETINGDSVLRRVRLLSKYRSEKERRVHAKIRKQMRAAFRNSLKKEFSEAGGVSEAEVEVAAEIEFLRLRNRAEMLGMDVTKLADEMKIREKTAIEYEKDKAGILAGRGYSSGFFSPSPGKKLAWHIAVRKDAEITTMVHELGHSWLYEMGQDWQRIHAIAEEDLTFAQIEYKFAMDHLAEEFGLDDLTRISDYSPENKEFEDKRLEVQEKFAQTIERYFLDGKFKDTTMQKVLETFRKYFVKIALTLRGVGNAYPHFPPLRMSPKTERMVTALLGTSAKQGEILTPMFYEGTFDPAILGKEGKQYYLEIKDAEDEAVAQFYAQAYYKTLREREKFINTVADEVEAEVTAEVDSRPSMIMLSDFQNLTSMHKRGEIESEPRISHESFVKLFDDPKKAMEIKKLIPKVFVTAKKKGGRDVGLIMQEYKIQNRKELIELLLESAQRDSIISSAANKMYEKIAPTFKTDAELHKIAEKIVNDEGRVKILKAEFDIMVDKYRKSFKKSAAALATPASILAKRLDKDQLAAEATRVLENQRLKGFSSKKLLKKYEKSGVIATEEFGRGNFEAAFEAKQEEVVLFRAYLMSQDLSKSLAKSQALITRLMRTSNETLAKTYNVDLINYARQLATVLASGNKTFPVLDSRDILNSGYVPDSQILYINNAIQQFTEGTKGVTSSEMNVGQYLPFDAAFTSTVAAAKNAMSAEVAGEKLRVEDIAVQIHDEIGATSVVPKTSEMSGILGEHLTPTSGIASMFSSNELYAKSTLAKVVQKAANASAAFDLHRAEGAKTINAAVRKTLRKHKGLERIWGPVLNELPSSLTKDYGKRPVIVDELGVTFADKSQYLMLLLYMGSESGAAKALGGKFDGKQFPNISFDESTKAYGETEFWDSLDRLMSEGVITEADLDMVQVIWDEFAKHHDPAKRAIRKVYKYTPGTIDARPFTVNGKTYRGGYVPVTSSEAARGMKSDPIALNVDGDGTYTPDLYPVMSRGHTKRRGNSKYELSYNLGSIPFLLSQQLKVAYMLDPMYDVGKILNHEAVREAFNNKSPGLFEKVVNPWYDRMLKQIYVVPADGSLGRLIGAIKKSVYQIAFLGNALTVAKQFLGSLPAMREVGIKEFTKAVIQVTSNPRDSLAMAKSKSVRFRSRIATNEANHLREVESLDTTNGWIEGGREYGEFMARLPIQAAQSTVDLVTWHGGYAKALKSGSSEAEAIIAADNAVDMSQGSAAIHGLATISHGTAFAKTAAMFTGYKITIFNTMALAYMQKTGEPNKARALYFVTAAVMNLTLPGLFGAALEELNPLALMKAKHRSKEEEEDYSLMEKLVLGVLRETIGAAIPVYLGIVDTPVARVKDDATAVWNAFQRDGVDFSTSQHKAALRAATVASKGMPFSIGAVVLNWIEANESVEARRVRLGERSRQLSKAKKAKKLERARR